MFIDANVFIHRHTSGGEKGEASDRFLERVIKGEQNAVTSPLVMDEVFFVIADKKGTLFAEKVWKKILEMPNLSFLPVDRKAMEFFLEFIGQGLEPRDAFHAATMRANGISTICSYDGGFDKVRGVKRQEPK